MYLRKKAFPNPCDTWLSKVPECHFGQCTQGVVQEICGRCCLTAKGYF